MIRGVALATALRAARPRRQPADLLSVIACRSCPRFLSNSAEREVLHEYTNDNVISLARAMAARRDALIEQTDTSGPDAIAKSKEIKELEPIHRAWGEWQSKERELQISLSLAQSESDVEMKELALEEVEGVRSDLRSLRQQLASELVPSDPLDESGAIMEFKPGVGGAESTLFLGEVVRMYMRYIQSQAHKGWDVEMISSTAVEVSTSTAGGGDGLKEAILEVTGKGVYGHLRYEAGVHRVQRIPATQSLGKIQTSTIAVVVLPLGDESVKEKKDDVVDPKDVKIEVMRSRGAGGQHVNKTESAVRLTHEPTGITVSMQDSRSQHQNRTKAWAVLRARLLDRQMREQVSSNRAVRQAQISGMDRSDRIRTYNFPQDRVTDHRVSQSLSGIDKFVEGADEESIYLGHMIALLREHADGKALQAALDKAREDVEETDSGKSGKGRKGK